MEIRKPKFSSRRSYRDYDFEGLATAYNAVKEKKMSIRKAAQTYNIPKSTLMDRLHGRVDVDAYKPGPSPMFTKEQEALFARHVQTMAEVGYGYSRQETINLASDYAVTLGYRDSQHPLTDRWLYNFLDRWPELKVKKPRSLDMARARSATRDAVDNYFTELHNILEKYSLEDKPHMIYNIDEKGLNTEHKPPKIVSGKHYKAQAVTSGRSKTVTVIGCVNAVGQQVPPYFVFPGAKMIASLMDGATPGAAGTITTTGWSNTEVFTTYLKDHLLKYVPSRSQNQPLLVLYDGHKSHVSMGVIEWAKSENIILFVLPPHCSHVLQPLDVSCFGPFQVAWNAACHHYLRASGGCLVTRYDVCRIACKVYASTLSASNIQAAFKKCGIFPFNPTVVTDVQLAPATTFNRDPEPSPNVKASVSNESITADNFLQERGGKILENVQKAKKKRNTLSKVVGGQAITEDNIIDKIKEHNDKYSPKDKIKKQSVGKENKVNKRPQKSLSPQPCTFGIQTKKPRTILAQVDTDSSDEEEVPESEKCIVCKRLSPDMSKKPFVIIVNWGQCEKCNGWVHLSFCSPVRF